MVNRVNQVKTYAKRAFALGCFCLGVMAQSAKAETLADALVASYEHSGLLKQNRALLRAADEDVAQAIAATLPIINWSLNVQRNTPRVFGRDLFTANLGLSGELTLYDNGANQFAIDAQKETVLGTRQSLIGAEMQILLQAVEAYVNLRKERAFLNLRQSNVALIDKEFRAAKERFEVGDVTQTDVALAQARLASAQSALAAAKGGVQRAEALYIEVIGRKPGSLSDVPPATALKDISEAIAYAVQNNPQIREAQHNVSASEYIALRAEAAMKPRLSVSGRFGLDQDKNDSSQLSLNYGGPVYQGGRLLSQVRQFKARSEAARASLHLARQSIERSVRDAYAFLNIARASLISSQEQVRAAQSAFDGVKEEASLGTRTTLDVLNAEQELLNARANAISAKADNVLSSYRVLFAMGLLTADYLELPVKQYDVSAYYNLVSNPANAPLSSQGEALQRVLDALSK